MDSTKIKPNDIAIILRPDFKEEEKWEGGFEVLISGYGPFTMSEDEVRELISMAMLMASSVSLMEKDEKFTETLMTHCAEVYTDPSDIAIDDVDDDFKLTAGTRYVGGMQ